MKRCEIIPLASFCIYLSCLETRSGWTSIYTVRFSDFCKRSILSKILSQIIKLGGHIIFTSKQTPGLIVDMIIFRGDTVRDRPEDIRAFVRGWLQASAYWKANIQEGNAIVSKALKIPTSTLSLDGVDLTDLGENQKLFQSSNPNSIYKTANIYAEFFIRAGNVTRIPKLKSLFNSSFLNPAS